jgi:hypothetical protein
MAIPSRCARGTNCSLGAQHVVLGDAQGGSSAPRDGEAPGTTLRLGAGLVLDLGCAGVHPFRQALVITEPLAGTVSPMMGGRPF